MSKILIIEDEELLRKLIKDYLTREDHIVMEASDGKEGLDCYYKNDDIDLILLDVMMPKLDGWSVIKEVRKSSDIPIIMLTAMSQDSDELYGFELGANDYVTKPFKPHILLARVKAHLKSNQALDANEYKEYSMLKINKTSHKVYVGEERIELSPKEYDLLIYLSENMGSALSRDQILNGVWGYDYFGDLRTVDTHIKRLRLKLQTQATLIQTVRGYGYRFEVEK